MCCIGCIVFVTEAEIKKTKCILRTMKVKESWGYKSKSYIIKSLFFKVVYVFDLMHFRPSCFLVDFEEICMPI